MMQPYLPYRVLDCGTLNNAAEGVGRAWAKSGVDASLEDGGLSSWDCIEEVTVLILLLL